MQQLFYSSVSPAGPLHLAYTAWGNPTHRLTICVHGLTRNSRDFDLLATELAAQERYVVCPDMVGRGLSNWLPQPELYGYPQMLADISALLVHLGVQPTQPIDWVGTSMGGLLGLMLACQPHSRIERLVLNDIGPFIPAAALERLGQYVDANPYFQDLSEAEVYLRRVHAPFGISDDASWRELTQHSVRASAGGGWQLHYDPAIGEAFKGQLADIDLWAFYEQIRCSVLVLRGAQSDLLLSETATAMTRRGPLAQLVEFQGCGHAPALRNAEQIVVVQDFLVL